MLLRVSRETKKDKEIMLNSMIDLGGAVVSTVASVEVRFREPFRVNFACSSHNWPCGFQHGHARLGELVN